MLQSNHINGVSIQAHMLYPWDIKSSRLSYTKCKIYLQWIASLSFCCHSFEKRRIAYTEFSRLGHFCLCFDLHFNLYCFEYLVNFQSFIASINFEQSVFILMLWKHLIVHNSKLFYRCLLFCLKIDSFFHFFHIIFLLSFRSELVNHSAREILNFLKNNYYKV